MFCPDLSHFFNGRILTNPAFSKKFGGTPCRCTIAAKGDQRICDFADKSCMARVETYVFTEKNVGIKACNCLSDCNSIEYSVEHYDEKMEVDNENTGYKGTALIYFRGFIVCKTSPSPSNYVIFV